MKAISWLEQALVTGALLREMTPTTRISRIEKALLMSLAVLGIIGFGFILYGGYVWAAERYGTREAAIGVGLVAWVLALLCAGGFFMLKRLQKKQLKKIGKYSEDAVMNVLSALEEPIRENPKMGLLLAAFAGYKAGQVLSDGT